MVNMKYVVVQYKYMTPFQERFVPIGIVLQTTEQLYFKFDLSEEKFNKIKEIYKEADPETFENFEKTFKESFVETDKIVTSNEYGVKIIINNKDNFFLDYLHQTFQSVYQYTQPRAIEGDNAQEILDLLFKQIVG